MKIVKDQLDGTVLGELGARLARARLDSNRTQADLAREAGISKRTIERIESGESTQLVNLLRVLRALDLLGRVDALVPESLPSPVEQLRLEGKTRERARPQAGQGTVDTWTWGDDR